jgi:prephenate dehydratase
LVGKEDPEIEEKKDKRSAVLISDDKPGSLLQGLKIFEELKLNLTKLESRPILGSPWEYKFYIDYQNDNNEIDIQLEEELKKVTKEFKIIGKYSSIDL